MWRLYAISQTIRGSIPPISEYRFAGTSYDGLYLTVIIGGSDDFESAHCGPQLDERKRIQVLSMPTDTYVFDHTKAIEGVDGRVEILRELASIFLTHAETLLAELKQATVSGNSRQLSAAVHALRGCIGSFHAQAMNDLLSDLHAYAAAGKMQSAAEATERVTSEAARLSEALRAFISGQ